VLLETSQRKFIISQSGSQFHLQLSSFSYFILVFHSVSAYKVTSLCVKDQQLITLMQNNLLN